MRPASRRSAGPTEFVALIGLLFAITAFSIDSMLPALPQIAAELSPGAGNRAALVIAFFVAGMGLGTLVAGPLSDSFGRKRTILAGLALYGVAALVATVAPTLETLLAARLVQGLGAAAPRVVGLAMVRDLHAGRGMARIVSCAMMVFSLGPAVAPLIGAGIIALAGWRGIFPAFLAVAVLAIAWLGLRQPETLVPAARRPFRPAALASALAEVLSQRVIVTAIAVQVLLFGGLFGTLSSAQQIFGQSFGRAAGFPLWFGLIALIAGAASLLNARLVGRLGMRRLVTAALVVAVCLGLATLGLVRAGAGAPWTFAVFMVWATGVFTFQSLTIGNLNAMAMEPVGHIAGMAAAVIGAIATFCAALIAAPIGQAFDGTPLPLILSCLVLHAVALALVASRPRRRVPLSAA